MNRQKRFALTSLTLGAAIAAGLFGCQIARSQPVQSAPAVTAAPVQPAQPTPPQPAQPVETAPAPETTTPPAEQNPEIENARQLLQDGKKFEAREMLTKLILPEMDGTAREEMRKMLDEINKDLFFSNKPSPDCAVVVVQPGDTLSGIALQQGRKAYFAEVIMRVNGLSDAKRIRPRMKLKIPQGPFSAIVQKHAHRLIVLLNGQYIKEYPVALGAPDSPTPEGKFVLDIGKAKDPDWTDPDGHVYKFGDPKNVLGTRWMPFKDTEGHTGLGIHGTTDPESVGKDVSDGCIRMRNADVEEIFGMLAPNDTVEITK